MYWYYILVKMVMYFILYVCDIKDFDIKMFKYNLIYKYFIGLLK